MRWAARHDDLSHRTPTTYTYDSEVTGSYGRPSPAARSAWQTCMAHEITMILSPLIFFGTSTSTATSRRTSTLKAHTRLVVTSTSVVNVE